MKKKTRILLILILAAGVISAGCGREEDPAAPPAPDPRAEVAPDAMVARVEGTEITGAMLNQQLNALIQQYSMQIPPEQLQQLRPMLRQQAVESLINQDLLLREALRQGVTPTEAEIDAQIEEIVAQFPSRAEFESQLGMAGMTMDTLREDIRGNLKIQKLVEGQFPPDIEATDEEIETFYFENLDQFEQPEQIEASHILIQTTPGETEESRAAKRGQLEALRERIEEGEDFAELAREASEDVGSADRGGHLGFFGRGQMIPEFEEAAFALEPGELSEIVETQFGYHLIQVSDKRDAGTAPLEEVSEQIGMFLTGQRQQEVIGAYLTRLREGADIQYGPGFQPAPPPRFDPGPAAPDQFPPAALPE